MFCVGRFELVLLVSNLVVLWGWIGVDSSEYWIGDLIEHITVVWKHTLWAAPQYSYSSRHNKAILWTKLKNNIITIEKMELIFLISNWGYYKVLEGGLFSSDLNGDDLCHMYM